MEIPNILIRQIQNGNVILFLGAGATKGAIHPEGKDSPSGKELSNLIAEHFLGSEYKDMPLARIQRPKWDKETLPQLGFEIIQIQPCLNAVVYNTQDQMKYEHIPLFQIIAQKV